MYWAEFSGLGGTLLGAAMRDLSPRTRKMMMVVGIAFIAVSCFMEYRQSQWNPHEQIALLEKDGNQVIDDWTNAGGNPGDQKYQVEAQEWLQNAYTTLWKCDPIIAQDVLPNPVKGPVNLQYLQIIMNSIQGEASHRDFSSSGS